jgi:hypothetical protein
LSHLSFSFFLNWQCHAKFLNVFFCTVYCLCHF